jgi:hypothetical protein
LPRATIDTIENELAGLLDAIGLSTRQARAISARLGWDGKGPATLAAAAQPEGYSRERVRQLEADVREKLERGQVRVPVVRGAVQMIERSAPDSRDYIGRELARKGIAARSFDPAGVLSAASITGVTTDARIHDGLVVLRGRPSPDRQLLVRARRLTSRHGAAHVDQLARHAGASPDQIRRLLAQRPGVTWLDDHQEWLRVSGNERRLTHILRKMLSISRSLTLAEVNDGLRRSFRPVVLQAAVLRRLCESFTWLTVDDDHQTVSSNLPLDQERVLSTIERRLVSIFQNDGPVLTFSRAVELGERAGLNRNSIGVYLSRTPILQTLSRGRYSLRGWAPATAG